MPDIHKIYCTKQVGSKVECYNRGYTHIGTFSADEILASLREHHKIIDTWDDWTGGISDIPGNTLWWDTDE